MPHGEGRAAAARRTTLVSCTGVQTPPSLFRGRSRLADGAWEPSGKLGRAAKGGWMTEQAGTRDHGEMGGGGLRTTGDWQPTLNRAKLGRIMPSH
jgi:hypothetical protein